MNPTGPLFLSSEWKGGTDARRGFLCTVLDKVSFEGPRDPTLKNDLKESGGDARLVETASLRPVFWPGGQPVVRAGRARTVVNR